MRRILGVILACAVILGVIWIANVLRRPQPGQVVDEALGAGRQAASFPAADEDYFHDMDGGITLTQNQIDGRNTWLVWTGGNDRLWDLLSVQSFGALDFLKTLSSHAGLKASRANRWEYLGLVNEPCFVQATGPDPERFGLWLDKRVAGPKCPSDPFENEQKYPGVKVGARGTTVPVGSFYGYATGVIGLRLFPNPAFDDKAAKAWKPDRYYSDPTYYNSKTLIKPYRVGMSCGFCHAGPSPINPPVDPENPQWSNLSSVVGAQYFWIDRIFDWNPDASNFIFQLFHTSRPGTLDTSLISADNINNPRTMNAVYLVPPRLALAKRWGKETLTGGQLDNKQFNDYVPAGSPLTAYFQPPATVLTPKILKDGSDSVGVLGALNRVYINIGTFSEEWLLHFRPLIGGKEITPIQISVARKNSAYFAATESQTFAMPDFLMRAGNPDHLRDAPGGGRYLTSDASVLTRGKVVFAETCARCHSSKLPAPPVAGLDPDGCAGKDYLNCWNRYWTWTKTPEYKQKMRGIVLANDFLDNNYLSTDMRIPVTLLHTNACSALATNALAGNIWDNFSSQSYKDLPSVGEISWYHPYTGKRMTYAMPAGGRGYTRVPSLVGLWSTAPYLLNNSVGHFEVMPTVDARMRAFQDAIEQMLWPEKRQHDALLGAKVPGTIDRTTATSYIKIPAGYVPNFLAKLLPPHPDATGSDDGPGLRIGPIPAGTPIDLLANLNMLSEDPNPAKRLAYEGKLAALAARLVSDLARLPHNATDAQAKAVFANVVDPLLSLSKCPDFVVNRGHYFGTGYVEPGDSGPPGEPGLSDQDKRALIEFLKTF
jgi:hypothetical protein